MYLTNGTQIPDGSVIMSRSVWVDGRVPCEPLRLVQYDDRLPVLAVSLWCGSSRYQMPEGAEVRIRWRKPDRTIAYNPSIGVDQAGAIYFQITDQMTAAPGEGYCNIEVTSAAGVKSSDAIRVCIAKNAVVDGDAESSDEWGVIDKTIARIEGLAASAESSAAAAATAADRFPDYDTAMRLILNFARQNAWTRESGTITLTNTMQFPFNNSARTVSLQHIQDTSDYEVQCTIVTSSGNVGDIVVTDKLANGFKLGYTGSAPSATIKYTVTGGVMK